MLYKFVLSKIYIYIYIYIYISPTKKMEKGKAFIYLDYKHLSKSCMLLNIAKKKVVQDFDFNLLEERHIFFGIK